MSDLIATPHSAGGQLRALIARLPGEGIALTDSSLLTELERVIGLTDAIQLHGLLRDRKADGRAGGKSDENCEASGESLAAQLRDDVLKTRKTLLDMLAEACSKEGTDGFLRWPNLDLVTGVDGLTPAQRLERFYIRFQQILQVRVQELRQRSRKKLVPTLPRLAELDGWLEQALSPHLEKGLGVIPRQLGRYCAKVLEVEVPADGDSITNQASGDSSDEPVLSEQPPSSRQQELRMLACLLFIAETDVRLEPILGLVEAIEDTQRTD